MLLIFGENPKNVDYLAHTYMYRKKLIAQSARTNYLTCRGA